MKCEGRRVFPGRRVFQFIGLVLTLSLPCLANAEAREYWIAADEILWDYAPSYPINLMTGAPFTDDQKVFVEENIGRRYFKAVYREYTAGFRSLKPRNAPEEHLGILGPIIRGEVGDTLVIHFRNNSSIPTSVHPHGVFYDKSSEGAPYDDGTAQKADDFVPPGGQYTYTWYVPERAGPGPLDPSSIAWPYHGHVDEPGETNAGLIGVIIITARGHADRDGRPRQVDREFVSLFTIFNENRSALFGKNLATFCGGCDPNDEEFAESNLMHSINGFVYGNNQGYTMRVGEHVRWYILGMGTEVDLHSPHWHGVTLLENNRRLDVSSVIPAETKTLDLTADNPGTWMFHCHVNDHIEAGMMTKFTVLP